MLYLVDKIYVQYHCSFCYNFFIFSCKLYMSTNKNNVELGPISI